MIGVKELRLNMGHPGSLPKIESHVHNQFNAMREAVSLRRKSRLPKIRLDVNSPIKNLGVDQKDNTNETNFGLNFSE